MRKTGVSNYMKDVRVGLVNIRFDSPELKGSIVNLLNETNMKVRLLTQKNQLVKFTI